MMRFARLLLIGLCLLPACTAVPPLSEADEAAIYTAVIEQIYSQDDTFGGTLQAPNTYILKTTDDTVGDPEIEQAESQTISPAVQSSIDSALTHLPTNILWVDDETAVPIDAATGAVENEGIILTLGNIHSQRNGTVQVSASIYVASLAAGGQTYILEKVDGVWQISGTTGVQWIS